MKVAAPRRKYSIAAVNRAVTVIDAVGRQNGQSLSEIARAAGLDESTALRYLSSLCEHGFVFRDERNASYHLGLRLYQLGQQAIGLRDVRKVALPYMERLLERFEETVNLAHGRGDSIVIIDVLESRRSIRRGATVGEADLWHASALGKAILAAAGVEDARHILDGVDRPRFTRRTLVRIDELLANLAEVRARGYAIDDEEYEDGLRCVAAAINDRRGRPVYAISISGVAARMPSGVAREMGQAVVEAANAISEELGYDPVKQQEEEVGA
jgi:IclR family transcriptional regulator, acetate operon repressor